MRPALFLTVTLLLGGCGAGERVVLGPPPAGPCAGVLALAPLSRDYTPSAERPSVRAGEVPRGSQPRLRCASCDEEQLTTGQDRVAPCNACGHEEFRSKLVGDLRPALSLARIEAELRERLAERGGFEDVLTLGPDVDPTRAARDAGAALLLELSVEDARCEFERTNWIQPLKYGVLVVSSILIFPAVDPLNWVLPGELYAVEAQARWRLRAVDGGQTLAEGELSPRIVEPFAAFGLGVGGRPWFLVGFIRAPDCLDEADWETIAGQLTPAAEEDVARAAVLAVEAATR